MSFVDRFIKEYGKRKDIPESPKKRRNPTLSAGTPTPAKKVAFRAAPLHMNSTDSEMIQEEPASDEIIVDPEGAFQDDDAEEAQENTEPSSSSKNPRRKVKSGICPFQVGLELYQTPSESKAKYDRALANSLRFGLTFDYSTVDRLISAENSSDDLRMMAMGFRGLMKVIELESSRTQMKKADEDSVQLTGSIRPSDFKSLPPQILIGVDGEELVVNQVLAEMAPISGSLRALVQATANYWISQTIPPDQRCMYSTSAKPQNPQVSFPACMLNAPTDLLCEVIKLNSGDVSTVSSDIAILFKHHCTYLFNTARSIKKKKH